ncbi:conjugal transfer protein [Spongiactinospora sp. TRM90649]|uniref:conjugal transfer protein n=1 Tax=Spongiactinospora sp. TRM90649 TaxID=3031114 RepID=UPI0023F621BD|nr:conjugal transfer protein [Spongiactinospora sp. TRM90649]MDF5754695.1 conjugal transfer protein [Spongiactinospora sp. TRM90649]
MARRSIVQQDPRVPGDPELSAYPESGGPDVPAPRGRGGARRGRWSGGGGRWLVWIGRAVLWAVIVVIVVNGVRAPFERFTQGATPAGQGAEPSASGFPTDRASSFAIQFAAVYLNFDATRPQERAGKLAPFLPEGADAQFGWDGAGQMSAGAIQPYGVEVIDSQRAVVTLIFQSGNRRMRLSVPVYYSGDEFVVSARPGVLPAPAKPALPQSAEPDLDDATANELRPQLQLFFQAYAGTDPAALGRFVTGNKPLENFKGAFTFVEIERLVVPLGGAIRDIEATVIWSMPPAATPSPDPSAPAATAGRLTQSYRLTVEKQGGKWFVQDIRGAGGSVG